MSQLILFLIVIGVLIFVHELGHFIAAKLSGIQVDEFALGFGPKIIGFRKGETLYRINILPLGGYVKMAGEGEYENSDKQNPRGFEIQHPGKKLFIILAGVTMNFLLACVIYTGFMYTFSFKQYIPKVIPNNFPYGNVVDKIGFRVDKQDSTSPISKFKLDSIYVLSSIDNIPVHSASGLEKIITENKGKEVKVSFTDINGENEKSLILVPRINVPPGKGAIGIILSPISEISFAGWQKPLSGVLYSIDMLEYNVSAIYTLSAEAIKTKTASVITSNLTGPVGVYEVTGAVYNEFGAIGVLNIMAVLSLALALMNVLPLPVLDGGFAAIIIVESIIRRPINPKVKTWINNFGIGFLVLLMVFVTYNDFINFSIVSKIVHLFRH